MQFLPEQVMPVDSAKDFISHKTSEVLAGNKACCTGVMRLLQHPSLPGGALHFAAVEGVSCQTGLLDGPAALLTSLLACGSTSDAGLAAIQAGQAWLIASCCCLLGSVKSLPCFEKLWRSSAQ